MSGRDNFAKIVLHERADVAVTYKN